mgnify:FL=1
MLQEREYTLSLESQFTNEEKVYLLKKSGFNVLLQIEGLAVSQNIDEFLQKAEADLKGFHYEFLAREPILRHTYEIKELNGTKRVTSPKYADVPLDDVTSGAEREGALKSGVDTLVQNLPEAPVGSLFVLTSPSGWSGLVSPEGKEYVYPESQTYIYKKTSKSEIEAITLRSDMTLPEHERLLGITPANDQSIRERVKTVASTVSYIPPSEEATFKETAKTISKIMSTNNVWIDANQTHTLEDILEAIDSRHNQDELEENTQQAIEDYKDFVRQNIAEVSNESLKEAAIALGKTVMRISYEQRKRNIAQIKVETNTREFYAQEAAYVESLTGCTTFEASLSTIIDSPFGPRSTEIVEDS